MEKRKASSIERKETKVRHEVLQWIHRNNVQCDISMNDIDVFFIGKKEMKIDCQEIIE